MFQTSGLLCSLVCLWSWLLLLSAQEPCTNNGDIRLVGGSTRFEGRIEVCLNSVWGTVCDDGLRFATQEQINSFHTVVCRQLGLVTDDSGFLTTGRTAPTTETRFGVIVNPASVPTHLDEVLCTGDERGIIDCIHSGVGVEDCGHSEDVGIGCSPGCIQGSIRLADGDSYNSGRVELCYNESWSTVADVTPDTANVICRQLGFSDIGTELHMYGQGFGQTVSIACQGDEVEFSACNVSTTTANYNHSRDSGVMCERCIDRCDLGSTREACLVTTASTMTTDDASDSSTTSVQEEEMTSQESTTTIANDGPDKQSATATSSCYAALGAIIGILLVLLLVVTTGWITTCVLVQGRAKGRRDYIVSDGVLDNNRFAEREFENAVYGEGYEVVGPTSPNEKKVDLSGELAFNESYGKVQRHEETIDSGQEGVYKSENDTYECIDTADSAIPFSPVMNAENPLYQTVEMSSDTAKKEDVIEYSVLDSGGSATEEPVESRPRKNKTASSEDEYNKLER